MTVYPRMASFKSHTDFTDHLASIQAELPFDVQMQSGPDSPLAAPMDVDGVKVGNRFCILPMEGWDGTTDGAPTDLTRRRWRNFGISGAKWMWGGEAVAVRHDGRANPNQLLMTEENLSAIAGLREELVRAHAERFGTTDDLFVGLQLTHSGRWAKPNEKMTPEPRTAQRNSVLDARVKVTDDSAVISDDELRRLIDDFIVAAVRAEKAGFTFVDVKHCHGYLGHELLSGVDRAGDFGGSFENRTRFVREIVAGIAAAAPSLKMGVRLSIYDFMPFHPGDDERIGVPVPGADPRLSWGCGPTGLEVDLSEPSRFLQLLEQIGVKMVCTTAGSPYSTPHVQRPAYFPPSDGYRPPEDPLVGVARQLHATAELKRKHPGITFVGSGYTYLQDWLPNVAQAAVAQGWVDSIGLGRMVLSYPEMPADVIAGTTTQRKKVCRTFSDCTTAPRNGMISGCFPLDGFYKAMPEREALKALK
ncbi:NADPH dehydrogenase [Rubripirellula lacrimiformis]|uniref:NADPH dehydrogenase n=1 Tax=Rubripirellula lacrimiformis TaxID=1930273 RepID=A0A517NFH1_9BACT|nr:NADH:flavin oxidoreductase [Rubripirellula lacrimiformis]QDT05867.1 NADPH dehydrogenase [Rubripirellula lacrimiformis]